MSVIDLTKATFEQEVLASDKPVLIDFWASWCGPCKMQSPIVDAIAEEYDGKIKVCKVDVDGQASLALDYGVMNIPTLVFMKDGLFVDRMVGLQSKETIANYIDTTLL